MSTTKTDLLQNVAGTKHPSVTKADFVKAWAKWTTITTTALLASHNISSIIDDAVGAATLVFTNPFSSAANNAPTLSAAEYHTFLYAAGLLAGSVKVGTANSAHADVDQSNIFLHSCGVLA